jgi:hypothetical protein
MKRSTEEPEATMQEIPLINDGICGWFLSRQRHLTLDPVRRNYSGHVSANRKNTHTAHVTPAVAIGNEEKTRNDNEGVKGCAQKTVTPARNPDRKSTWKMPRYFVAFSTRLNREAINIRPITMIPEDTPQQRVRDVRTWGRFQLNCHGPFSSHPCGLGIVYVCFL